MFRSRVVAVPLAAASDLRASPIARAAALGARAGALAFAAFLPISIAGMQIGLGVAAAGVVVAWGLGARVWRSTSPVELPVLLLTGAAMLSVALAWAAGTPPASLFRATLWKTFLTPLVVAAALELELPGERAGAARGRALAALTAWAIGAIVVGAVALAQPWTGFDPLFWARTAPIRVAAVRASWPGHFHAIGFYTQYALLALNLLPPLALALGVATLAPIEPRRRRLLAVGTAAAALSTVLTLTRSAWVALAVAGAMLVVTARRAGRRALAAAAALGTIGLAVPGIRMRFAHGATVAANADRLLIWRVCGEVRADHPWVGTGLGNFAAVADPYFDRLTPGWLARSACHDTFLSFLVEGGPLLLAAGILYFVLLGKGFLRARRAAAAAGDALAVAAAVGALAALAGTLSNALVHDVFHSSESAYGIGFAVGCAAVLVRTAACPGGPPARGATARAPPRAGALGASRT